MFIERFLVLVAWQTHGLGLPWPAGTYHPTLIEWSVLAGLAAAAVLVFLLLVKVCPAGTAASPDPAGPPPAGRRLRSLATAACLIFGFAAAGVGLALSAGLASAPFLDPILPGSPLVFLAGLFLMLLAPVAYELIPDGKPADRTCHRLALEVKVGHSEVGLPLPSLSTNWPRLWLRVPRSGRCTYSALRRAATPSRTVTWTWLSTSTQPRP